MNTDIDEIKYKALETAVYCPPFKEENSIETIILEKEFDVEKAKDAVRSSVVLLSYNKKHKPMILEILDILDQNKHEFLLDQQKYITFYWNGILICKIEINKDVKHNKQLHVSLQKYSTQKDNLITDQKTQRMMLLGFGGSLLIGGIIAGISFFRTTD